MSARPPPRPSTGAAPRPVGGAAARCAGRGAREPGPAARPRPGLRGLRRRCRARLGLGPTRADHGRLRAERRGGSPRPSPASLRPQPPQRASGPPGCCSRLSSADGGPGQRWSGAGTRWCCGGPCPAPASPTCSSCCFAPPAIVGLLVLAKRPVTKAGWVCLGLDAWLIGGSLLTLSWSLALAHTAQLDGPSRGARRAVAGLPAAGHRPGQHGARAALPALRGQPLRGQHRDRRARADRAVRRPVHLAAAARALPLGPAARRRAGSPARCCSRTRPGWAAARERPGDGHTRVVASLPGRRGGARRHPRRRRRGHGRYPPTRPIAGSLAALTPYLAAAVCTLGILYNVARRPQRRPRGAPHRRARSCSPSSSGRASCCSTTSPSPRNWRRRRTTSAPWSRAPATSS